MFLFMFFFRLTRTRCDVVVVWVRLNPLLAEEGDVGGRESREHANAHFFCLCLRSNRFACLYQDSYLVEDFLFFIYFTILMKSYTK